MPHVLVDMQILPDALAELRAIPGIEVDTVEWEEKVRPLPEDVVRRAEILFCTLPPANFAAMERLRLIQITSSGYSQLFGLGLLEKGVRACNGRGCFDVPIAEWIVAMIVNLARNLRQMIRNQDLAVWDRAAPFQREVRGSTVGIWGYGGIGRETARLAKAMGMTVHVLSRAGVGPAGEVFREPGTGDPGGALPDRVFLYERKFEFLAGLDFLVLVTPLTHSTEGMVGEAELQALPKTAYLLNPGRGPLIQEQALLRALSENWIAGAALDAHFRYPLEVNHPLWSMPHVILTPHISGAALSPRFAERLWRIFLENVRRHLAGHPLLNELTPEQLRGE